jgi:hypothetical protein
MKQNSYRKQLYIEERSERKRQEPEAKGGKREAMTEDNQRDRETDHIQLWLVPTAMVPTTALDASACLTEELPFISVITAPGPCAVDPPSSASACPPASSAGHTVLLPVLSGVLRQDSAV